MADAVCGGEKHTAESQWAAPIGGDYGHLPGLTEALKQNSGHLGGATAGSDHPYGMQQWFSLARPWMVVGCGEVGKKQETKKSRKTRGKLRKVF